MSPRTYPRVFALALLAASVLGLRSESVAASTTYIQPGQSWADVLRTAQPGDTVVIRSGTYPRQTITQSFTGTVDVVGESTTGVIVQGLNLTGGASNLRFSTMTIQTAGSSDSQSAVKIYGGAHDISLEKLVVSPLSQSGVEVHNWGGAPHDIRIIANTITGAAAPASGGGRNVWVGDLNGGGPDTWPTNVEIAGNDLSFASADAVHISGGTSVTIEGNEIHDVRDTTDHNDGIQSVASDGLRIVGNRITSPGTWSCTTCVPPDQAIIVGDAYPATAYKKVTGTYIADNIIHHWRGKGLMLTGTYDTRVVNNTVTHLGPAGSTAAAALTVSEPYSGYTNREVRIWNNVIDRLSTGITVPITYIGHNCIQSGGFGEQTITADPRFSDTTREFTLAPDSPCRTIGWANATWETPTVDFAGIPRSDPPDAGAREHPDGTTSTTAPSWTPTTATTTAAPAPTTTAAPATTTTQVPTWIPSTTTTTAPSATTVAIAGNFGGRGGQRAELLTSRAGTLTGRLDLARGTSVLVEVWSADGVRLFSSSMANGQTFSTVVPAGTLRVEVTASSQTRFTLSVELPA